MLEIVSFFDPLFTVIFCQFKLRSFICLCLFHPKKLTVRVMTSLFAFFSPPTMPPKSSTSKSTTRRPPTTRSGKTTDSRKSSNSISDQDGASGKRAPKTRRVHWSAARTERLLDWLDDNPEDRQKLFSDSSKDAKDEGRRKRVAKNTKSEFHKKMATYIFSADSDPEVRADFLVNPVNYIKSVDNYIIRYVLYSYYVIKSNIFGSCRLRKEYRGFNESLGQTGAGLRYEDIDEGSDLKNLVGEWKFLLCYHH